MHQYVTSLSWKKKPPIGTEVLHDIYREIDISDPNSALTIYNNRIKDIGYSHQEIVNHCQITEISFLLQLGFNFQVSRQYKDAMRCYHRIIELNPTLDQRIEVEKIRASTYYFNNQRNFFSSPAPKIHGFFSPVYSDRKTGDRYLTEITSRKFPIIRHGSLIVGCKLGRGSFGIVHKGRFRATNQDVAIKYFLTVDIVKSKITISGWINFVHEIAMHAVVSNLDSPHPNIVALMAICTSPLHACIIFELMNKGSLKTLLKSKQLSLVDECFIGIQIANAVCYLHEKNVIHQDIKPENVLVNRIDGTYQYKLADYGSSHHSERTTSATTICYTAPEVFRPDGRCTEKTDIWALALLLWYLKIKKQPYSEGKSDFAQKQLILQGKRVEISAETPVKMSNLMVRCWLDNPNERPTANEFKQTLMEEYECHIKSGIDGSSWSRTA